MTGLAVHLRGVDGPAGRGRRATMVESLQQAQAEGVRATRGDCRGIRRAATPARAARAAAYLRDNVKYGLGRRGSGGTADVPRLRRRPGAGAAPRERWSSF